MAPSGRSPCSLKPTTRGISIDIGWPSIAASASMPPTPQPRMPEAVDHRRVRVGPDERVGIRLHRAVVGRLVAGEDHAREVLEVDLVHDPGVRRDGLEALEGGLAPAQERVALLVALELLLGVDAERVAGAEDVDLHGVVDHQLDRHERVDLGRVAAEVGHRVAHRGEVDDAGHAREVLQHDARGRERDLLRRLGAVVPRGERLDVGGADARPRPRCGAGSRAGPSGRRAGGRRRTSTAARRAGRSRNCGRRPRALRVRQRSCQPCLHITPGPAATPPRSPPRRARRPSRARRR